MHNSMIQAFHPESARPARNTCGGLAPRRNVGQRLLGVMYDTVKRIISPIGFGENLDGDPLTLSHIYMPLGLVAFNFLEYPGAPWSR